MMPSLRRIMIDVIFFKSFYTVVKFLSYMLVRTFFGYFLSFWIIFAIALFISFLFLVLNPCILAQQVDNGENVVIYYNLCWIVCKDVSWLYLLTTGHCIRKSWHIFIQSFFSLKRAISRLIAVSRYFSLQTCLFTVYTQMLHRFSVRSYLFSVWFRSIFSKWYPTCWSTFRRLLSGSFHAV